MKINSSIKYIDSTFRKGDKVRIKTYHEIKSEHNDARISGVELFFSVDRNCDEGPVWSSILMSDICEENAVAWINHDDLTVVRGQEDWLGSVLIRDVEVSTISGNLMIKRNFPHEVLEKI